MRRATRKLGLSRQTIRWLTGHQLDRIGGGEPMTTSVWCEISGGSVFCPVTHVCVSWTHTPGCLPDPPL